VAAAAAADRLLLLLATCCYNLHYITDFLTRSKKKTTGPREKTKAKYQDKTA